MKPTTEARIRIRFLTSAAGLTWSANANEVLDFPEGPARAFIRSGVAEPAPNAELGVPARECGWCYGQVSAGALVCGHCGRST